MERGVAFLYVLIPSFLYGSVYPFTKIALTEVSPTDIALYRSLFGLITLILIFRSFSNFMIKKADLVPLAVLSLCGISLFRILLNLAIEFSKSSEISFLSTTYPSISAILAYFILSERLSMKRVSSALLGLGGSYIIITGGGGVASVGGNEITGGVIAMLASLTWAFYIVLVRWFYLRASPEPDYITANVFLLSLPPLTLLSLVLSGPVNPISLSAPAGLSLMWLGFVASSTPYFLFNKALKVLPASSAGLSLVLTPLIGSLLSVLLLGESIGLKITIGGGMIVLASALIHIESPMNTVTTRRRVPS